MSEFVRVFILLLIYYPILLEKGFSLSRIPVLVLKSRETWSRIQNGIGTFIRFVSSTNSVKDLKRMLITENSCGIALELRRKTQQKTVKYDEIAFCGAQWPLVRCQWPPGVTSGRG